MNPEIRAILLAAALLAGPCGVAQAAGRSDDGAKPAQAGAPAGNTGSVGAGGLTGSGATQDGARRTGDKADDKPSPARGATSAPAAGTAR